MPYQQMTLATLRSRLTERWDGAPWWTTTDANQAINEALRVWGVATGYWREPATAILVPNDPFVVLTAPLVSGARVIFNNMPLMPAGLLDLDMGSPGWQTTTRAAGPYLWVPISLRLMVVWPALPTPAAGPFVQQTVTIDGMPKVPILSADGDYVNLGQEEINAILDYAVHAASISQGAPAMDATEGHRQRFWIAAQLRNEQLKTSLPLRFATGRADAWLNPPRKLHTDQMEPTE